MAGGPIQKERITDLGAVRLHNDVIASIAAIAATEIKGVYKLGGAWAAGLYDMLSRKSSVKGVKIISAENDLKLQVSIIVEYGVSIPTVADEVQENVKRQVEKMTGLALQEVTVDVEGVHMSAPKGGRL